MGEVKRTGQANQPNRNGGANNVDNKFKSELKNKSDVELKGLLKDRSLSEMQRNAVVQELTSRKAEEFKEEAAAEEEGGGGGGGLEGGMGAEMAAEDLDELLMMLLGGMIDSRGMERLARMLGVDPKDLGNMGNLEKQGGTFTVQTELTDIL